MEKPLCPKCRAPLRFRRWSNRLPVKSEALAECKDHGYFQIRYWDGVPTSEPYQVKMKSQKTKRGSHRLNENREAAIVALWGSVQNFLDKSPLVCMPVQYKP